MTERPTGPRTESLCVRLAPGERRAVDELARAAGLSRGDVVRRLVGSALERVAGDPARLLTNKPRLAAEGRTA